MILYAARNQRVARRDFRGDNKPITSANVPRKFVGKPDNGMKQLIRLYGTVASIIGAVAVFAGIGLAWADVANQRALEIEQSGLTDDIGVMVWHGFWPWLAIGGGALVVSGVSIGKYRELRQHGEAGGEGRAQPGLGERAERRLRLATEGAGVGVWYWDMASGQLEWSERCKTHLALRSDQEPSFANFYASVHPEDREPIKRKIEQATEKRGDYYAEYRIVNPDGSIRWIAAPGRVYSKPDGTLDGMSGLTIDISKLKETERELAQSQKRFRMLAENASDVVLETDRAGNIRWASPTAVSQLGRDACKLVETPLRKMVHPEEWDAFDLLEQQVGEGTPTSAEVRLKIDDDGFLLSVRPLFADDGNIGGHAASLRDIQKEVHSRETLKAERWHLKTILDSLIDPHALMQPVLGDDGRVTDFVHADVNAARAGGSASTASSFWAAACSKCFPPSKPRG